MNTEDIVELYNHIARVKKLKRAGWVRNNTAEPESVADHSFGLAILAMQYAAQHGLDANKAAAMAVMHDIGESIIGDITPHDATTKKEKKESEKRAVKEIVGDGQLYELWLEFEEGSSPEAQLMRQLDKLEAYLQGLVYGIDTELQEEFYRSTKAVLNNTELKELLESLEKTDKNLA